MYKCLINHNKVFTLKTCEVFETITVATNYCNKLNKKIPSTEIKNYNTRQSAKI